MCNRRRARRTNGKVEGCLWLLLNFPVMSGWKGLLSFIREWGWLTLSLASGGLSIIFALIFLGQGKEPPKNSLIWILVVCSILSAWFVALRERKARTLAETPFKPAKPDSVPISASTIRSGIVDGQYIPKGTGYAAVCCLYYHEGGPALKDVRAQIIFRSSQSGEEHLKVSTACWLHERTPSITFKGGTTRHIVVAQWGFHQAISVPKFLAGEVEMARLPAIEPMDVTLALYAKDGTILSEFYYRMLPGANADDGFNRLAFEVKRD